MLLFFFFFFFNDTATTEIYTLSLHDALPISISRPTRHGHNTTLRHCPDAARYRDRKSTRLNSSRTVISYAVFCLKKKNKHDQIDRDEASPLMEQLVEAVLSRS